MDVRQAIHSEYAKTLDTTGLREAFLVERIFERDALKLTYSHIDRIIVGGVWPVERAVEVPDSLGRAIGVNYLLERRELGAINIGGDGWVDVDGTRYTVRREEAIYIGKGAQAVVFGSADTDQRAKFYLNCAPAHTTYPTRTISSTRPRPKPSAIRPRATAAPSTSSSCPTCCRPASSPWA